MALKPVEHRAVWHPKCGTPVGYLSMCVAADVIVKFHATNRFGYHKTQPTVLNLLVPLKGVQNSLWIQIWPYGRETR